jgi:hypothetical protein
LIVAAVAVGLAVLAYALTFGAPAQQEAAAAVFGAAGLVGCIGIGVFSSSWFAAGPGPRDEQK